MLASVSSRGVGTARTSPAARKEDRSEECILAFLVRLWLDVENRIMKRHEDCEILIHKSHSMNPRVREASFTGSHLHPSQHGVFLLSISKLHAAIAQHPGHGLHEHMHRAPDYADFNLGG